MKMMKISKMEVKKKSKLSKQNVEKDSLLNMISSILLIRIKFKEINKKNNNNKIIKLLICKKLKEKLA